MRPARSIERVLLVLVVVHACTIAVALCRAPYDTLLDEGLQRALLVGAIEAGVNTSQGPKHVYLLGGDDAEPDVGHVLTSESFALDVDCGWMLARWVDQDGVDQDGNALPPSVVPPSFRDVTDMEHARWYLVSAGPGNYDALHDELRVGRDLYAVEAYAYPRLELFLVHIPTLAQFENLMILAGGDLVSHVMENYPLRPAWDSAQDAIGYPRSPFLSNAGDGYAIAVIDTGVDKAHFGDRVILEACFSSAAMLVYGEERSKGTCGEGSLDSDLEDVYPDGIGDPFSDPRDEREPYYHSYSSTGDGSAEPCTMDYACKHGTQVAYIAAGSKPEHAEGKLKNIPSGLASGASIISIRVASEAPASYCRQTERLKPKQRTCVVIFPLDVLRALAYLVDLEDRDLFDGDPETVDLPVISERRLAAVNLSLQVNVFCNKDVEDSDEGSDVEQDDDSPAACEDDGDEPYWDLASYSEDCVHNEFTPLVNALKERGTWTVIGAGNQPGHVGVVSLPACVGSALTVAGVREGSEDPPYLLYATSMFGGLVDLAAPGHRVLTPAGADTISGTSYAAPQVSGALVLIRERLRGLCDLSGVEFDAGHMDFEETWLKTHAKQIKISAYRLPDSDQDHVIDRMVLSLEDEMFDCTIDPSAP